MLCQRVTVHRETLLLLRIHQKVRGIATLPSTTHRSVNVLVNKVLFSLLVGCRYLY